MTYLAGFLDVVLRGGGLVAFAAAVGGAAFVLIVLDPLVARSLLPRRARTRSLRLVGWSGVGITLIQLGMLTVKTWALAEGRPSWPVREFLGTDFAIAAIVRMILGLALGVTAFRIAGRTPSRRDSAGVAIVAVLLAANAPWLSHALARLEDRPVLMALDAVHRTGAAIWVGGLIHLLIFWSGWRADRDNSIAASVLARFSALAVVAIAGVAAAGAWLSLHYIDSLAGLVGTGYGVMLLSKVVLLIAALLLGALNFLAVRRLRAAAAEPPSRIRWFIEAEVGLGVTVLLAAAALTSLPPTVDVRADRVEVADVAARFLPRLPRITSPPVRQLIAAAAPISDVAAPRQPEEYAWSEYNHHMAGLFVVSMGLLACLERGGRARWARHWPLLLLGLAAFLFVRNDPRAWPLGPAGFWETLVLPDVLQHRIAVLLVVGLGVFEWLVRTRRLRSPRWSFVFPVLCAAGGALLLTHSHAMFNLRAEFLTEVAHTPLGILGVFIGCGRWLELRLSPPDDRIPGRIWAVSMVLIGTLLIFYREG
jgi:putative copper resistance protein D